MPLTWSGVDGCCRTREQADKIRGPLRGSYGKSKLDREDSMKLGLFTALLLASTIAAGTAQAQPAAFNEVGVTMGH